MRTFVPTRPLCTKVTRWTWTRGHGLRCHYTDGTSSPSAWTLRELLAAGRKSGDGLPAREVTEEVGRREKLAKAYGVLCKKYFDYLEAGDQGDDPRAQTLYRAVGRLRTKILDLREEK